MPRNTIEISPCGSTKISAFSLKDDSWEDFHYFLNECKSNIPTREKNRALRAAHFNLYAHFEGVVHELEKDLLDEKEKRKTLKKRCNLISTNLNIRTIDLPGREVRNEITHPGDDDYLPFSDLTKENIEGWAKIMSDWLDKACNLRNVSRFKDTKKFVLDFSGIFDPKNDSIEPI